MNPHDAIRESLIRCLYDVRTKARSPRKTAIGIRDLNKLMKERGCSQKDVAHNLRYLIDQGFVNEIVESRTFTTSAGTQQNSQTVTYGLSAQGVDQIEKPSLYEREAVPASVSIVNVNGVTQVGNGNVVTTGYTDLSQNLMDLRTAVLEAADLSDVDRLNVVADIDTIRSQLQKPQPDKTLLRRSWDAIASVATAGGAAEAFEKAAHAIAPLLS